MLRSRPILYFVRLLFLGVICFSPDQSSARSIPHPLLSRFAIKDMSGVVAWRDLRIGRRALNTLLAHAPKLSRFDEAAKRLRELEWSGFKPFLGETAGLDPIRGLYLFWTPTGEMRLLIMHQPGKAVLAMKEVSALIDDGMDLKWSFELDDSTRTPMVSQEGDRQFKCSRHQEVLVCDTSKVSISSPPYWLDVDIDRGAIWAFIHMPSQVPKPFLLPWESAEIHCDLNGDELSLSLNLGAGFNSLLSLMTPNDRLSTVTNWVHEDSPVALKLSLDPELIKHAGILANQIPWLKQAKRWVESGWGGEVLLTFDGGLDHPVLLFSLQSHPWSGEQLSQQLSGQLGFGQRTVATSDVKFGPTLPLTWWTVPNDDGDPWLIPTLLHDDTLMMALFPADLKRRTHAKFTPSLSSVILQLEKRGVSGGLIDPTIFELPGLTGGRIRLGTLGGAILRLLQEGGGGLVDVPAPLQGEEGSLAESLSRLSRFEDEVLVKLLTPLSEDEALFIALSDLASLLFQLTEDIRFTIHSFKREETGDFGLAIEVTWGIL